MACGKTFHVRHGQHNCMSCRSYYDTSCVAKCMDTRHTANPVCLWSDTDVLEEDPEEVLP